MFQSLFYVQNTCPAKSSAIEPWILYSVVLRSRRAAPENTYTVYVSVFVVKETCFWSTITVITIVSALQTCANVVASTVVITSHWLSLISCSSNWAQVAAKTLTMWPMFRVALFKIPLRFYAFEIYNVQSIFNVMLLQSHTTKSKQASKQPTKQTNKQTIDKLHTQTAGSCEEGQARHIYCEQMANSATNQCSQKSMMSRQAPLCPLLKYCGVIQQFVMSCIPNKIFNRAVHKIDLDV